MKGTQMEYSTTNNRKWFEASTAIGRFNKNVFFAAERLSV
jgi:hypothetical protein